MASYIALLVLGWYNINNCGLKNMLLWWCLSVSLGVMSRTYLGTLGKFGGMEQEFVLRTRLTLGYCLSKGAPQSEQTMKTSAFVILFIWALVLYITVVYETFLSFINILSVIPGSNILSWIIDFSHLSSHKLSSITDAPSALKKCTELLTLLYSGWNISSSINAPLP